MRRRQAPEPSAKPVQPATADPAAWIAYMRWLAGAAEPEQPVPLDRQEARTRALREGRFSIQDL